jgi:diphosphate-dependent phosphofructokinase
MSLETLLQKQPLSLPDLLKEPKFARLSQGERKEPSQDVEELRRLFPKSFGQPLLSVVKGSERSSSAKRVGVVFSGGQASGGHNVIAGLFDTLKKLHPESRLFGFLGGPGGIVSGSSKELTAETISSYRNMGGFDLIGSGRTKIESAEQLTASLKHVSDLKLDGLVVIGGDDSNTNAALLAEYFLAHNSQTSVIGVPKTIDGDLQNAHLAISFGFDTACKTYAEMIGNIARDALSAKKYTHFIKLMGRSASHIALECALQTAPNVTLIGEEVAAKGQTLASVTEEIVSVICKRAELGKNYGVVLIPEGLIEFIPEVKKLISELNNLSPELLKLSWEGIKPKLSAPSASCFESLPLAIQKQLLLERDPHGNVQVSLIETEQLLIELVRRRLSQLQKSGEFKGKFSPLHHFFGYEGRAAYPSHFDANFCTALGATAALLIDEGVTGYMSCAGNLHRPLAEWTLSGLPLTMLMNIEMRHGAPKPVIQKALVKLEGKAFARLKQNRQKWALEECYTFPGPIQYFGPAEVIETLPLSLG